MCSIALAPSASSATVRLKSPTAASICCMRAPTWASSSREASALARLRADTASTEAAAPSMPTDRSVTRRAASVSARASSRCWRVRAALASTCFFSWATLTAVSMLLARAVSTSSRMRPRKRAALAASGVSGSTRAARVPLPSLIEARAARVVPGTRNRRAMFMAASMRWRGGTRAPAGPGPAATARVGQGTGPNYCLQSTGRRIKANRLGGQALPARVGTLAPGRPASQ